MAEAAMGLILVSGDHDRLHAAFLTAATAAALGRPVTVFATHAGCRALTMDWPPTDGAEATLADRGVATLAELRDHAMAMGVRCVACEAGLRATATPSERLIPGVTVGGMAGLLGTIGDGTIVAF